MELIRGDRGDRGGGPAPLAHGLANEFLLSVSEHHKVAPKDTAKLVSQQANEIFKIPAIKILLLGGLT